MQRCKLFAVLAAGLWLAGLASPCQAIGPPPRQPGWLDPLRYRDWLVQGGAAVRRLEFVEMFTAVVSGSDMGPGDGWFHPSQSRYGWAWLAAHCGVKEAKITREQFKGPAELFDRLDRNRDGTLTPSDFDWSDRSLFAMQSMPSRMWFYMLDTNSNGRLSREEWLAAFDKAAKDKGYLTADDLREMFPTVPPPRPANAKNSGPSMGTLLLGLFKGELGSPFEGPRLGERGPDFTLWTPDGQTLVNLAQFRGDKPVVLVFGSFT
jgi:hypothetical protein